MLCLNSPRYSERRGSRLLPVLLSSAAAHYLRSFPSLPPSCPSGLAALHPFPTLMSCGWLDSVSSNAPRSIRSYVRRRRCLPQSLRVPRRAGEGGAGPTPVSGIARRGAAATRLGLGDVGRVPVPGRETIIRMCTMRRGICSTLFCCRP